MLTTMYTWLAQARTASGLPSLCVHFKNLGHFRGEQQLRPSTKIETCISLKVDICGQREYNKHRNVTSLSSDTHSKGGTGILSLDAGT